MVKYLKQSTAATLLIGQFVDSIDGYTAKTALVLSQADTRISKNGGDPAQKHEASNAVHKENGYYAVYLDATDTDTLGRLRIMISKATALGIKEDVVVLSASAYANLIEGV